jgi:uncharacterized protein (TIGR03067 family)
MKTQLFAMLAVVLCLGADASKEDVKKEKDALQGVWKAVSVEENGQSKDDNEDHRIVFKGDEFDIKGRDQSILKGVFKIDPSKNPKELDLEVKEDLKKGQAQGKTALAIYTVDGDTLKLCVNEPGATERPKEFVGQAGTKHIVVTLKREKS